MPGASVTNTDEVAVHKGGLRLIPKYASIATSASSDTTVVGAVAARKVRVLGGFFVASAASSIAWRSGAGGTGLTGSTAVPVALAANGGVVLPIDHSGKGYFETSVGAALVLYVTATNVAGSITYIEVSSP